MLYVLCEGQTEALFVSRILDPQWMAPRQKPVQPITVDGLRPFSRIRDQIRLLLRYHAARVTTLIDYYGMPADYPGMPHRALPPGNPAAVRDEVARLEAALATEIGSERFLPYYALHEFETLAFVSPAAIAAQRARLPGPSVEAEACQMLSQARGEAELVNDSEQTSPCHRLERLWPKDQYQKTVDSLGIVHRIPFDRLQAGCPHFGAWTQML